MKTNEKTNNLNYCNMKNNLNSFKLPAKTIYLAIFVSTTILCFGCNPSLPKGELTINNDTRSLLSDADLASHKPFDVEIYKTMIPMGPAYGVTFYQNENGKLNHHSAYWGEEGEFDKAAYKWLNDTTVSVRLYNSSSQKEVKFKVFGFGSRNGMSTD
jgi:hypothetical protein